MENTSATVQSMGLFQPSKYDDNAGDWTREVVAHELAHQWFGDLLTCRDWRERWLNEGFAEYMAGAWMADAPQVARPETDASPEATPLAPEQIRQGRIRAGTQPATSPAMSGQSRSPETRRPSRRL